MLDLRPLVIMGTGSFAKELAQLVRVIDPEGQRWSNIMFSAPAVVDKGARIRGHEVCFVDDEMSATRRPFDVALGVGVPGVRQKILAKLVANDALRFPNLVHPGVEIDHATLRMGRGNIICKGAVLSVDITLGDGNLINWNATIGHDVAMGHCNVINPGANVSGYVSIADGCLVGAGSQILERVALPHATTVGAGAVVTKSPLGPGLTLKGIPARA
jgi:sugar O-acyltransferase (sialic acid O-acetyltransferase NeuD family)